MADPLFQGLRKEAAKLKLEVPSRWDFSQENSLILAPYYWPEGFSMADASISCFSRESAFIDRMVRVLRCELGLAVHVELEATFVETIITMGIMYHAYRHHDDAERSMLYSIYLRAYLPQIRDLYMLLADAQLQALCAHTNLSAATLERARNTTRLHLLATAGLAEVVIVAQRDVEKAGCGESGGGGQLTSLRAIKRSTKRVKMGSRHESAGIGRRVAVRYDRDVQGK